MLKNSVIFRHVLNTFEFECLGRHYENYIPVHRFGQYINIVRLRTESVQECRLSRANVAFHGHSECLSASERDILNFCFLRVLRRFLSPKLYLAYPFSWKFLRIFVIASPFGMTLTSLT